MGCGAGCCLGAAVALLVLLLGCFFCCCWSLLAFALVPANKSLASSSLLMPILLDCRPCYRSPAVDAHIEAIPFHSVPIPNSILACSMMTNAMMVYGPMRK